MGVHIHKHPRSDSPQKYPFRGTLLVKPLPRPGVGQGPWQTRAISKSLLSCESSAWPTEEFFLKAIINLVNPSPKDRRSTSLLKTNRNCPADSSNKAISVFTEHMKTMPEKTATMSSCWSDLLYPNICKPSICLLGTNIQFAKVHSNYGNPCWFLAH